MHDEADKELLSQVVDTYLGSGDFNGLALSTGDARAEGAKRLIRDGLIEVISGDDFPNPHIRPWASPRSPDARIESVTAVAEGRVNRACLYPLATALADLPKVRELSDRPYRQRIAAGGGQLDVAYFRMDVLENYRNDPRFTFTFDDFGAQVSVTERVYDDETEPDADKVSARLGFAYRDLADDEPIVRLVVAFLRDLVRLSPEHQRRWETYEVPPEGAVPHPVWWSSAMGHWTDRIGPFDALFAELSALNELYERAFGVPLLRRTERPPDFGWMLRPSQREFDDFVHILDKLLSDNLRHEAFNAADIERKDSNGDLIGTLNRLDRMLQRARVPSDQRSAVMKPLKDVRLARGGPAHALRTNITDANFVRQQAELVRDVTESVVALRRFWQTHPNNLAWQAPSELVTAKRIWL